MNRTIIIVIGILAALLTAAGIMCYNDPINTARRNLYAEDPGVRLIAIDKIIELHDKASIPEIAKLLKHGNPDIRRSAIHALGLLNAKEAIPDITGLLSDPDTAVRLLAVSILYKLEAKESRPQIIRLLSDPEFLVRITAIAILGNLNAKEAIPDIKKLLSDPNSEVCQTAEKSLKLLGVPEEELELLRRDREYQPERSEIEEAKERKLSKYHVIFAHNALIKYNDGKTSSHETIRGKDSDIKYESGKGRWIGSLPNMTHSVTYWDGVDENGKRISGSFHSKETSIHLSCFAGDQVSNTSISFSCSGSLEGKKFDEHFTDIKWGHNASFTVQSGDFKMEVDIQPYLCPGCDKCAKENDHYDKEFIQYFKKLLNDGDEVLRKKAEQALKKLGVPEEEIQKAKEDGK